VEGSSLAKTSSIRSSVLIEHRFVTDSQTNTDRRRHRHRVIASTRASIVSRGVKLVCVSLTSIGLKLTRPSHLARAPLLGYCASSDQKRAANRPQRFVVAFDAIDLSLTRSPETPSIHTDHVTCDVYEHRMRLTEFRTPILIWGYCARWRTQ